MNHLTIIVSGKVQGVFFRASAKEVADQVSIRGFVQNLPDGRVHIEAEGTAENLEKFVDWCRQGPPRAQVNHVDVQENALKNFEGFEIKR